MKQYNPKEIELKWQKIWEDTKLYQVKENPELSKYYDLEFFPYPSGSTMHVGHVRNYTISDAWARYKRMQGYNVLHPMGWDSFGLPAENFAIKTGIPPRQSTDKNIETFSRQLKQMGLSYDWSREIDSSLPKYYRWTQWCFLLLYKLGLAYQDIGLQNWCPADQTVLANEQVVNGKCERCGSLVEKKELKQWFFKITDYADRLLSDLDELDWPESIKAMQRNWIGKSAGAEVDFKIDGKKDVIKVFTTRPDTLFGATYMVLAPEHPLVHKITSDIERGKVETYVRAALSKTELERQEEKREKTGVFTGTYAINPANNEKIPIWVADYVLMGYGTGAIMAVPAHDERDWEFANKFELPIRRVIKGGKLPYIGKGEVIDSGKYTGMASDEMDRKIIADLAKQKAGRKKTNYKMRDWLISRQRYWGAPIPIIHCQKCGTVPVPDDQLPVKLPEIKSYKPSGDGRSPLARVENFVKTSCPKCGGQAQRETDTMDGFACSSWYFLRFTDPCNDKKAWDKEKADYWMPVDMYIGGAEHAVMHLLYARFWTKVFYDQGLTKIKEPFYTLRNQGMIGGPDGRKMGKRYGNVVTPDDLIEKGYGADALRIYEVFIAPYDQAVDWNVNGINGTRRFLERLWVLTAELIDSKADVQVNKPDNQIELETNLSIAVNKAIKKVTTDLEEFGLNTAIAALMELLNGLYKIKVDLPLTASINQWRMAIENFLLLLAPFAPHITEELWVELGHKESIHIQPWPKWDKKLLVEDFVTIVVQVNGRVRANISAPADLSDQELVNLAKQNDKVKDYLGNAKVIKTVTVPNKLINFVIA